MKTYIKILVSAFIFFFAACTSSQESVNNDEIKKEEIYIFDDSEIDVLAKTDSLNTDEISKDTSNFIREDFPALEADVKKEVLYTVQVGAFSTRDKAELFVSENRNKIDFTMEVNYSEKVNLFVVWIPKFKSREEAENVRNNLWKIEKFKDAFIVILE
ncbi:MAG: SPOR domain-containing protein [Bacteroidetes bacterium]|nr:SPOR domain-containing protein [Bacteroidota bacterium]